MEDKKNPTLEDGKEKKEDEQKAQEAKPAEPTANETTGKSEEKGNLVEQARIENDRKAELLKEETALQERKEKLHAEQMVGGKAGMSEDEKPKRLSDTEYAEALQRGEVNPLKEDGFLK